MEKARFYQWDIEMLRDFIFNKRDNYVISTEHGPKGSDEININLNPETKIRNFGWPISSYGDHYKKIIQSKD